MPPKKRITRVFFTDASRTANQLSMPPTTSRPACQLSNSPSNTRAASFTQKITPTSPSYLLMSVPFLRLAHRYLHLTI